MGKIVIGYTQGVFDMFHIGHLNLINRAKEMCDVLVVGVNSDDLVMRYKHKKTVVPEYERYEIVSNIRAVDRCMIVDTLDKRKVREKVEFSKIFIGDDWKGDPRWLQTEQDLKPFGVDVVYLPYTKEISSTILRIERENRIDE